MALTQLAALNLSPNSEGAGLWQGGAAPTADADGNIYIQTGDGHNFNITGGPDWGDTVLKLKLNGGSFSVVDWFMPYNQNCIDQATWTSDPEGMLLPTKQPASALTGGSRKDDLPAGRDLLGNFNLGQ